MGGEEHDYWQALLAAGVAPDDVDVRRYGTERITQACNRLQEAVADVAALWCGHLEAATVDDHRALFEWGRAEHVYPRLKDAYDAFFEETRRAMVQLEDEPRFIAALDAARVKAEAS